MEKIKWELVFKPSTLITIVLLVVVLAMALANSKPESFYEICGTAIKILCGALGGAVAGEKYTEKLEKNDG